MESALCTLPDGGCLIETFGWTPERGVDRLELHLARLESSAKDFGIPLGLETIYRQIEALRSDEALRCRLTLSRTGEIDLNIAPMPAPATTWNFAIADETLDSSDMFLRHKTSKRERYDAARANLPKGIDEVVFLNERDEVCEGTITNILVKSNAGEWLTPPISCGCLPGTYRQFLLNSGNLKEAILSLSDLQNAKEIRLCNALRGEIEAALLE